MCTDLFYGWGNLSFRALFVSLESFFLEIAGCLRIISLTQTLLSMLHANTTNIVSHTHAVKLRRGWNSCYLHSLMGSGSGPCKGPVHMASVSNTRVRTRGKKQEPFQELGTEYDDQGTIRQFKLFIRNSVY